jgi:hypothetical protein
MLGLGPGSSDWVELRDMESLLRIALKKGINNIQILVDSKICNHWINAKYEMHNIFLQHVLGQLNLLKNNISDMSFSQICRKNNGFFYGLPKEVVQVPKGVLDMFEHKMEGFFPWSPRSSCHKYFKHLHFGDHDRVHIHLFNSIFFFNYLNV